MVHSSKLKKFRDPNRPVSLKLSHDGHTWPKKTYRHRPQLKRVRWLNKRKSDTPSLREAFGAKCLGLFRNYLHVWYLLKLLKFDSSSLKRSIQNFAGKTWKTYPLLLVESWRHLSCSTEPFTRQYRSRMNQHRVLWTGCWSLLKRLVHAIEVENRLRPPQTELLVSRG